MFERPRQALALHRTLLVAALLTTASVLSAQTSGGGYGTRARQAEARAIVAARPVEGRLTAADPRFDDDSHFQVWKFSARAGDSIAVTMRSQEFAAFLMLVTATGDIEQPLQLALADSSSATAELALRVPVDGDYLIVANTQRARATGRYQLTLRNVAAACAAGSTCAAQTTSGGVMSIRQISVAAASPITIDATRDAALRAQDPQLADSSHFNAWRFDGQAGQRVVIDLTSTEFDTYLLLARQTALGPTVFHQNDDAPSTAATLRTENSQLAVELPAAGSYLIIATSFRPKVTGRYQLRMRSMDAACAAGGPCTPTAAPTFFQNVVGAARATIALGDTVRDRVGTRDASIGDGTRIKAYRFSGRAGDEVAIFLDARAPDAARFDPYLHLLRRSGDSLAVLRDDDDSGGHRNALVTARLPETGEYFVVANGVTVADTGNFTLGAMRLSDACARRRICSVGAAVRFESPAAAVRALPADTIALGATLRSSFTPGSARFPDRKPFASWRYRADSGERVVITNRAEAFDAFLYVYGLQGDSVVELARDDDGGGGLHAQIAYAFPAAGEYLIVASSFATTAQGDFEIALESMDSSCAAGGPCAPGQTIALIKSLEAALAAPRIDLPGRGTLRGSLASSTPRLSRGGRYQGYRFTGRAGERVVLTMQSSAFDPYLHLAALRDSGLRLVASDDDSGAGRNARLVATLPASGEYLVVASAFEFSDSTGMGAFTIARGPCDAACDTYREVPGTRADFDYQPARRAPWRRVPAAGTVDSMLQRQDPTLTDRTPFHAYQVEGRRGATLRAALHSPDFDAFVALLRVEGDSLVLVAADDDGGEGRDALVEWPIDRAATYLVVATAYAPDSVGRYVITIEQGAASGGEQFRRTAATAALRPLLVQALAAPSRALQPGVAVNAQFIAGSVELASRGRFQTYRFSGRAGDRIALDLTSTQFDAFLYLARIEGGTAQVVFSDDDGGGGTNARISGTLPADGEYLVIAAEFNGNRRAKDVSYRLVLSQQSSRQ